MKLRAILMLILASMAFGTVACGNTETNPDEKKDEKKCKDGQTYNEQSKKCEKKKPAPGKNNDNNKGQGASGASCSSTPKHERCDANKAPTFGKATKVSALEFPEANPAHKHPNALGAFLNGDVIKKQLAINSKVEKALKDGDLNLILEFSGWTVDTAPTDAFPTFLWLGEKDKTTISKPTGTQGSFSAAYLDGSKIVSGATISTNATTLTLPLKFEGMDLELKVADAKLEGKVEKDGDGVKLTDGVLSGKVMKDSMLKALQGVATNTCGYCMEAQADWFGYKGGVNSCETTDPQNKPNEEFCKGLSIAINLKTIVEGAFTDQVDKPEDSSSVVIELGGTPFKISGFAP